jgi:hypothetical protein
LKNKETVISNKKIIFQRALNLAKLPIVIAMFVTPVRFFLELAEFPENVIFIVGLLWLALAFSVYWGIKLYSEKHSYLILLLSLVIFSPISRFPVAVLWWITNRWELGTHYSLYFDSLGQALFNHVIYGSLVQIIPGFLLGSLTLAIMQRRKSVAIKNQIQ